MAPSTIPLTQGLSGCLISVVEVYAEGVLCTVLTPAVLVIAGTSLAIGYFLGTATGRPTVAFEEEDGDGSVEEVSDGDLSAIIPGFMEPCKMVRQFFSS
jgi:hypothetical protein